MGFLSWHVCPVWGMVRCLGLEVLFFTPWLHDSCVIMNSTVPFVFGAGLRKQVVFKHFFLPELAKTTKSALYNISSGWNAFLIFNSRVPYLCNFTDDLFCKSFVSFKFFVFLSNGIQGRNVDTNHFYWMFLFDRL